MLDLADDPIKIPLNVRRNQIVYVFSGHHQKIKSLADTVGCGTERVSSHFGLTVRRDGPCTGAIHEAIAPASPGAPRAPINALSLVRTPKRGTPLNPTTHSPALLFLTT